MRRSARLSCYEELAFLGSGCFDDCNGSNDSAVVFHNEGREGNWDMEEEEED